MKRNDLERALSALGGIPVERIEEICDAERDGRCVVPPCKVGDTVYYLTSNASVLNSRKPDRIEQTTAHGFYCGALSDGKIQIGLSNYKGNHGNFGEYRKTVFLTRAEAEAALIEILNPCEATIEMLEKKEAQPEEGGSHVVR